MTEATIPAYIVWDAIRNTRDSEGHFMKINAIKEVRDATCNCGFGIRVGLREAKEMVEAVVNENGFLQVDDNLPF